MLISLIRANLSRMIAPCAALGLVAGPALAAPADDIARLYALPPAGSAYVRIVNPTAQTLSIQLGAGARAVQLAPREQIATDYRVVTGGKPLALRINGKPVSSDVMAPASGFVTMVVTVHGDTASVKPIADAGEAADGLKAELAVYNLVPACAASVSIANGPTVFSEVAENTRAARSINPVSAELVGACADKLSAPFHLPMLKAGDRYSLFLVGTAASPVLIGQENRTEPYRAP